MDKLKKLRVVINEQKERGFVTREPRAVAFKVEHDPSEQARRPHTQWEKQEQALPKIEALDAQFMRENGKARQCFANAMVLMKDGKTEEAKKLMREGEAAQRRAEQIFKQMKEAAQQRNRADR
jgi:PTS system, Lactose/Cellobiose specific IIA subunit